MKPVTQAEFKRLFLEALGYEVFQPPGRKIDQGAWFILTDSAGKWLYSGDDQDKVWGAAPDPDDLNLQEKLLRKVGRSNAVTFVRHLKIYRVSANCVSSAAGNPASHKIRAVAVYNAYAKATGKEQVSIKEPEATQ